MAIGSLRKSSVRHEMLIQALARKYEEQGYYVKADHIGHRNGRPPEVNGHVPDVAAYYNGMLAKIAEAETCDTLSDSDTREQWQAFGRSSYRFDVIVPKTCYGAAQAQARSWGVSVNEFWYLDV